MKLKPALEVNDRVRKITGYKFPGIIVAKFIISTGETRVVVEALHREFSGMLHIYRPDQLEKDESLT